MSVTIADFVFRKRGGVYSPENQASISDSTYIINCNFEGLLSDEFLHCFSLLEANDDGEIYINSSQHKQLYNYALQKRTGQIEFTRNYAAFETLNFIILDTLENLTAYNTDFLTSTGLNFYDAWSSTIYVSQGTQTFANLIENPSDIKYYETFPVKVAVDVSPSTDNKITSIYPDGEVVMTVAQALLIEDVFPDNTIILSDTLDNLTTELLIGFMSNDKIKSIVIGTVDKPQPVSDLQSRLDEIVAYFKPIGVHPHQPIVPPIDPHENTDGEIIQIIVKK